MLRLIGDIGGTNARFGLVEEDGSPGEIRTLAVADHPGLVEAALAYLAGRVVEESVIAVATPVETDFVRFTNSPWSFSVQKLAPRLGVVPVWPLSTTSSPKPWPCLIYFRMSGNSLGVAHPCPVAQSA